MVCADQPWLMTGGVLGADVMVTNNGGWTPLDSASLNGHVDVVLALLEEGKHFLKVWSSGAFSAPGGQTWFLGKANSSNYWVFAGQGDMTNGVVNRLPSTGLFAFLNLLC